ncbi:MAG: sulfatase, partial [bacterium]
MDFSTGFPRRHFLRSLGGGFGALALEGLRQTSCASEKTNNGHSKQQSIDPLKPFEPRDPDFRARAKSVIFLFLVGGPSQ